MSKRRIPTTLTDEELAAIYRQVNEDTGTGKRTRALLQTMADCGLRVSEACHLRTEDLERDSGRITSLKVRGGKGGKDRVAFVGGQLSDKLLHWLDAREDMGIGRGYVFTAIGKGAVAGRPIIPRYVQRLVPRLAEKAGIEKRVTPHVFRHTFATRLLRDNNLRVVQESLGHAQLETTEIYTHVENKELQEAALALPAVDGLPAEEQETEDTVKALAVILTALPQEQRQALAAALTP